MGVGAGALGELVFVVRELQIQPAAVDVEVLAQQLIGHGGAFDVPAGAASADRLSVNYGAIPSGLVGVGRLPQDEIHRVFFERGHFDTRACDHVVDAPARQFAVAGVRAHAEQGVAVAGVGVAFCDQVFDHCHHRRDVLGGAGGGFVGHLAFDAGAQGPQRVHVGVIPADGFFGPLRDQRLQRPGVAGFLAAQRLGVDLVIHVGEIAHVGDVFQAIFIAQQAVKHVEHHHGAGVAKVGAVVNRGAADIHAHIVRVDRGEDFLRPRFGVVQFDRDHVCNPDKTSLSKRGGCPARV